MDNSDLFECLSLIEEIYNEYPFTQCVGYVLLNNILLSLLRHNLAICIHCERDLLENIVKNLLYIIENSTCSNVMIQIV